MDELIATIILALIFITIYSLACSLVGSLLLKYSFKSVTKRNISYKNSYVTNFISQIICNTFCWLIIPPLGKIGIFFMIPFFFIIQSMIISRRHSVSINDSFLMSILVTALNAAILGFLFLSGVILRITAEAL